MELTESQTSLLEAASRPMPEALEEIAQVAMVAYELAAHDDLIEYVEGLNVLQLAGIEGPDKEYYDDSGMTFEEDLANTLNTVYNHKYENDENGDLIEHPSVDVYLAIADQVVN